MRLFLKSFSVYYRQFEDNKTNSHNAIVFNKGLMDTLKQNNPKKDSFLETGFKIDDRFEIIEPIRKTSGCIVYRAKDLNQGIDKALLMIPAVIQADVEAMGILKEAARSLMWLKHPRIATFYDLHTRGVYNYFEMEYVSGKSIKRKKHEISDKKISEDTVRWIALQVLEGLSFAHGKDLIHKNIKPQKIILTDNRQISLIDFGVTGALRNAMALVRDTTSKSAILFMPPEQLRGKPLTFASDIYSLGATLYYLLESRPPFNHGDIHYQILNEEPNPIQGISDAFNQIILKCLAKDITQRYQTCEEMINDIENISAIKEEPSVISSPSEDQNETVAESEPVIEQDLYEDEVESEPVSENIDSTDETNPLVDIIMDKVRLNKSILIWIAVFIIAVISVLTIKVIFNSGKKSDSTNRIEKSNQDEQTSARMTDALNSAADKLYAKGQLITPKGNNALEMYLEVLEIDPDEKYANERIETMKAKLYNDIKNNLDNWMLVEADELIKDCLVYFKDDERFEKIEEEYEALMDRADKIPVNIEILNGAGKAGIAGVLSKELKKNNFKIVNSDNYRVNGRVNWNVRTTMITGSLPKNNRIEKLEKILNLTYKQDKLPYKQFKSANIIIVIGADYKTIPVLKK